MIYFDLLIGFLKVGLFSFGGGYVSIALIREIVESRGWMEDDMLTYMIAVSESTPGPLMVNLATYVGSAKGGFFGALIATAAVVLPAFLIILLIISLLQGLIENRFFKALLGGLKPCIIGIILATGLHMVWQNAGMDEAGGPEWMAVFLTVAFSFVYFGSRKVMKKGLSPIGLICLAAVAGAVCYGFVGTP